MFGAKKNREDSMRFVLGIVYFFAIVAIISLISLFIY